jgi:hypothetical protein
LTQDTCIHVPARATDTHANIAHSSAASAGPMMPRRPMTFLLKRAEF